GPGPRSDQSALIEPRGWARPLRRSVRAVTFAQDRANVAIHQVTCTASTSLDSQGDGLGVRGVSGRVGTMQLNRRSARFAASTGDAVRPAALILAVAYLVVVLPSALLLPSAHA